MRDNKLEWLQRIKVMVADSKITGTISASTIVAARKGAETCLTATAKNPKAAAKGAAEFRAKCKPLASATKKAAAAASTKPDALMVDVASELVDRLGVKHGVDVFSTAYNRFIVESKKQKAKNVATDVSSLSLFVASLRKKLNRAVATKNINEQAQLVASIAIVPDDIAAKPFIDALSRFVIVLDSMTLRKGSAPEVVLDAAELLVDASVLLKLVFERLDANANGSKDFVLALLSALIKIFQGPGPTKEGQARTLKRLDQLAFSTDSHNALVLRRMMGGNNDPFATPAPAPASAQQQPPPPYPPAAPAPYPYPPGPPAPYGPYPTQQVIVHERADPYMKTVMGLSAGAQCCQCCATWGLVDAISDY